MSVLQDPFEDHVRFQIGKLNNAVTDAAKEPNLVVRNILVQGINDTVAVLDKFIGEYEKTRRTHFTVIRRELLNVLKRVLTEIYGDQSQKPLTGPPRLLAEGTEVYGFKYASGVKLGMTATDAVLAGVNPQLALSGGYKKQAAFRPVTGLGNRVYTVTDKAKHLCGRSHTYPVQPDCRCGFYAHSTPVDEDHEGCNIGLLVKLWGSMVIGTTGFRAEYQQVLAAVSFNKPFPPALEAALNEEGVRTYRGPVYRMFAPLMNGHRWHQPKFTKWWDNVKDKDFDGVQPYVL